jgi:hypothetical protein
MLAGQITGLRDLPDGQKGRFVKVQSATGGNIVHGLHRASSGNPGRLKAWAAPRLERRDSTLEEQPKDSTRCDWDHVISINSQLLNRFSIQIFQKGAQFGSSER